MSSNSPTASDDQLAERAAEQFVLDNAAIDYAYAGGTLHEWIKKRVQDEYARAVAAETGSGVGGETLAAGAAGA